MRSAETTEPLDHHATSEGEDNVTFDDGMGEARGRSVPVKFDREVPFDGGFMSTLTNGVPADHVTADNRTASQMFQERHSKEMPQPAGEQTNNFDRNTPTKYDLCVKFD